MKTQTYWNIALFFTIVCRQTVAQVGVNILTPHSSAALQVVSPPGNFRGLLSPTMTAFNRITISSGTSTAADGLIVYDVTHRMPYYFNGGTNRWVSMSPFVMSTPANLTTALPYGAITTPSAGVTFSVGINTQVPSRELDVVGQAAISGSVYVGGNETVNGSLDVIGNFTKNGFPVNPFVPAGTIVMWHGTTLPAGWVECNGSNGTPDLRGKFIVAAGQAASTALPGDLNPNYAVNTTGGENRHVLSKPEIPKHSHKVNGDGATVAATGGSHAHSVPLIAGITGVVGGSGKDVIPNNGSSGVSSPSTHSHPNSEFSGQTGDGTSDGLAGQPHENRPHYYALRFIMKQ